MPIFPYDEEEKKRLALTPGFNPNLPDLPVSKPRMLPPPGMPDMPAPEYHPTDMAPPSRYQRLESEKQGYLRGTPGRAKSALTGALEGFLGGGGLAGAATGAIYGAASPKRFRERQFETYEKPKLMERFGYEDQAAAQQRQAGIDEQNAEYRQAQIGELQSQAYKNRLPPPAPRSPQSHWVMDESGNYVDLNAPQNQGRPVRGYRPPKEPTRDELTIEPTSGKSYEQIAEESYQGRGGDKYVFERLPERTRRLINGEIADADPQEIAAANQTFQSAITRQRKTDLDYTRGSVRAGALGAKRGNPQAKQGGTGISRPRSQFNSKKYPGLKFD